MAIRRSKPSDDAVGPTARGPVTPRVSESTVSASHPGARLKAGQRRHPRGVEHSAEWPRDLSTGCSLAKPQRRVVSDWITKICISVIVRLGLDEPGPSNTGGSTATTPG